MDKEEYKKYLKTVHWYGLRQLALGRAGHKCATCQSNINLDVHHKLYRDSPLDTVVEDLIVLCRPCHKKEHGLQVHNKDYKKPYNPYSNKKYRRYHSQHAGYLKQRAYRQGWSF